MEMRYSGTPDDPTTPWTWGDWIVARAKFLGFRSNRSFVEKSGCEYHTFYLWKEMATPPRTMRKGHDLKLASALRVDPMVLFSLYVNTDPRSEEITLPVEAK